MVKEEMMKGKYLITTDNWFVAPDGNQYKAVWGDVEIITDTFLGIKTNAKSTNWFAKIGSDEKHVVVAGCQIHYASKSDDRPYTGGVSDWQADASNGITQYESPSRIYIAE